MAIRSVVVALALAATLAPAVVAGPADSADAATKPSRPIVSLHPATVVQQDPITVGGRTTQRRVTVYRRLYGGAWTRLGSVRSTQGRFSYRTLPVAGRTNLYRTSAPGKLKTSRVAVARSIGCAPLPAPGSVATWVQDGRTTTTLTRNWARLICSAAPHSTITMAEMYVYSSITVARLVSALSAVHYYRGVHVRVLVQRSGGIYTNAEWAALKRRFAFAELHYCTYGCHSDNPNSHAHTKFMVLSKTIFGRSAVLESSANWSHDQFDRLRQSGIYVYGNTRLTRAYLGEWSSLVTRSVLAAAVWTSAGSGIWFSFDPHPASADPIVTELRTLTCDPGDSIGVADTVLSRPGLVTELQQLAAAGCRVRVLINATGSVSAAMRASTRAVVLHDKFLVIDAHNAATGSIRQEVVHGSENFTTGSMTVSDQQLLLLRRPDVYASYHWWFGFLWQRSVPLPPAVPTTPPVTMPPSTPPTATPPTTTPPTASPSTASPPTASPPATPPDSDTTTPPTDTTPTDTPPDTGSTPADSSGMVAGSTCAQPVASADDDTGTGVCADQ